MAKAVAAAASTTTTACVAPPYSSKFDAHCGGVGVDVYVANLLETTWKNPSMICVVLADDDTRRDYYWLTTKTTVWSKKNCGWIIFGQAAGLLSPIILSDIKGTFPWRRLTWFHVTILSWQNNSFKMEKLLMEQNFHQGINQMIWPYYKTRYFSIQVTMI